MIRGVILALAIFAVALPLAAHSLNVFASVSDDTVNVEVKFSNGKIPKSGEIRVLDAKEQLIMTIPLDPDGVTSFPVTEQAKDGLVIEVVMSNGHEDYWLLTPDEIAKGRTGNE